MSLGPSEPAPSTRVLTVPNLISFARLLGVPAAIVALWGLLFVR